MCVAAIAPAPTVGGPTLAAHADGPLLLAAPPPLNPSPARTANMMDVPGARWRLVARLSFDDQQRAKDSVKPWWLRWLAAFRPASGPKQPAAAEM